MSGLVSDVAFDHSPVCGRVGDASSGDELSREHIVYGTNCRREGMSENFRPGVHRSGKNRPGILVQKLFVNL